MNTVNLIGRIAYEPIIREKENMKVAFFSVVIGDARKEQSRVDYISCVLFGKQIDFLKNYCGKGDLISIEGKLNSKKVEIEGRERYELNVFVHQLSLLQKKKQTTQTETLVSEDEEFELEKKEDVVYDEQQLPF